jgi:MraZ protein
MVDQDAIFGGENISSIDSKGRTCIPAKYREGLVQGFGDERFVITRSQPIPLEDGSFARGLSVYPLTVWQQIKANIMANEGGYSSLQLDGLKRHILIPAEECGTDKLGRVLIPPNLRERAALEREIWFVGMGKRFDIWSRETYNRVNAQDERNLPLDLTAIGL